MKFPYLFLSSSILVSTVCGQTAALRTNTAIGVYAQQGARVAFKAIPGATGIRAGAGASVTATLNNTFTATLISFVTRSGTISASLGEQGGVAVARNEPAATAGTSPSPTARFTPGPHSILLSITARAGSAGLVEVWAGGGLSGRALGRIGTYSLDIGDNGSAEFKHPLIGNYSDAIPVRIPASGVLRLKLESEVKATQAIPGGYLYKSALNIRFRSAPLCLGVPFGQGCGPTLSGTSRQIGTDYLFDLRFKRGVPNSPGLLIVGDRRIDVAIPGVQCHLLVNPVLVVGFRSDGSGEQFWLFRFMQSTTFNVPLQAADLGGGRGPRASNGLRVLCMR